MINFCIVYGLLAGLLFRGLHHHRLVVPGQTGRGPVLWIAGLWTRMFCYALIMIMGFRSGHGLIPTSYFAWWDWYFVEHSMGAWITGTCTLTLALYLVMTITYLTGKDPHGYKMYDPGTGEPTLLRTTMKTPAIWYLIFWSWILLSPWLPFYRCFIRIFLLGHSVGSEFPAF